MLQGRRGLNAASVQSDSCAVIIWVNTCWDIGLPLRNLSTSLNPTATANRLAASTGGLCWRGFTAVFSRCLPFCLGASCEVAYMHTHARASGRLVSQENQKTSFFVIFSGIVLRLNKLSAYLRCCIRCLI